MEVLGKMDSAQPKNSSNRGMRHRRWTKARGANWNLKREPGGLERRGMPEGARDRRHRRIMKVRLMADVVAPLSERTAKRAWKHAAAPTCDRRCQKSRR